MQRRRRRGRCGWRGRAGAERRRRDAVGVIGGFRHVTEKKVAGSVPVGEKRRIRSGDGGAGRQKTVLRRKGGGETEHRMRRNADGGKP